MRADVDHLRVPGRGSNSNCASVQGDGRVDNSAEPTILFFFNRPNCSLFILNRTLLRRVWGATCGEQGFFDFRLRVRIGLDFVLRRVQGNGRKRQRGVGDERWIALRSFCCLTVWGKYYQLGRASTCGRELSVCCCYCCG